MIVKQIAVLAVATLSALIAGGGVIALASAGTQRPQPPQILRGADGHFWVDADVGIAPDRHARVHFLVDTGSSSIALTKADAERIGVDMAALGYSRPVFTAEGEVKAAPILLDRVEVAGAEVKGVRALVLKPGSQTSLLGMSYLGRLSRIEATPSAMTLHR